MDIDHSTPGPRRDRPLPGLQCFAPVCAAASAASGVSFAEIAAKRRGKARVARARHLAIYLQHVVFSANFVACGRLFGRDRTSVRNACARIEDARDEPLFDAAVTRLEHALRAQRDMLCELFPTGANP